MRGIVFCTMLACGSPCFAADGLVKPGTGRGEVKTAGLFGLSMPGFGSACNQTSSCGYGGCGYGTPRYGGSCNSGYRYPSYGNASYGYSSCGPNGCYPSSQGGVYSAPVMYQPGVPYSVPAYTVPAYGVPAPYSTNPASYSVPYQGTAPFMGYSEPAYAPYGPVNYGVPYGSRGVGTTTAGYRPARGANSPFYP